MGLYEKKQERAVLGNGSSTSQGLSSAQSHVTSASSPFSVLSLYLAKPYSLQGTVLLDSALQILVLPSYKTDDNDFTF